MYDGRTTKNILCGRFEKVVVQKGFLARKNLKTALLFVKITVQFVQTAVRFTEVSAADLAFDSLFFIFFLLIGQICLSSRCKHVFFPAGIIILTSFKQLRSFLL
ncbi:MAG: hypothetical protein NC206_02045 [Bacteroides sp.]|nr:hypothetical protein [Roseburia sp.]MCM1345848.1 hypothetical protein [Bacteroides sp.]MCM1420238.1 hypothetical protein [Bacteroides sp.]